MRVEFNGLKFDLPQGWMDITEDLPSGSPPSLAREFGVGTVQFSIAKYRGGEEPNVTIEKLQEFLEDFFRRHNMSHDRIIVSPGNIMSAEAESIANTELVSARYFSNGKDVVLATYMCPDADSDELEEDLRGVKVIMNSMEF